MSVRKKETQLIPAHISEDVFEEVIKQDDKVEQFTIKGIDSQIEQINRQISALEGRKEALETRKAAAQAL